MNKALFSSEKMDWCTPNKFFEELDETYNFKLDVAADHDNAKCERYYTEEEDGLIQSWKVGGVLFGVTRHMAGRLESGFKKHTKNH